MAYNTGDETISGNVTSSNSLYAGNFTAFDFGAKTTSLGNNILASASSRSTLLPQDILARDSASKLGPFSSNGDLPPGYPLLLGNPAIDAAANDRIGTFDQWNRLRIRPDVGALEAVSASATGSIFVDLNSNLIKDSNEVGLADIAVFLDTNGDGIKQSSEIATVTAGGSLANGNNSELGRFSFQNIAPTKQNFRAIVPDEWQASAEPLARVGIGAVQGNGNSTLPAISPSGRTIAFLSNASNLVAGDDPNPNVFVYSRDDQSMERLPHEGMNLRVLGISGDQEQFVLLRDDTAVFLYDRKTKGLEPVSLSNSGELANGYSDSASANQDGNWIAFSSFAKNLVPNDSDNFSDIFLFNRAAKTVISVSLAANGVQGNNDSEEPSISNDGRYIAFVSDASNLVANDRNGLADIFVYDRINRSIRRVNLSGDGSESNGFSYPPFISGNGRFVVFQSLASNLVAGDTNATSDLLVVDLQSNAIERLAIPFKATSQAVNYRPSISDDGQYIVFEAFNSILVPSDTSSTKSVFVYDRFTSQSSTGSPLESLSSRMKRISQPSSGQASNGDSVRAAISKDGRTIAFQSTASNLVMNDTNQLSDIFTAPNPFESASRSVPLQVGQELTTLTIGLSPKPGRLSGTLFNDVSSDEVFDLGDPGLAGWTVYLDVNNNGRRDGDEPIAISQENGSYLFEEVPSFREYVISVETPLGWVQMTPLPNTNGSRVFLPAADGTGFKSSSLLTVDAMPTKIALADIDSDLDLDIVVATQTTNATGVLKFYLNNGQGVFTPGASISSGGKRPMSMVIQDFNRDQILDIAIANQGDFGRANDNGNVSVIFGLGNGGFASATSYLVGAGPLGIDTSDLNGDGFQDLVVVNFSVNTASILRGNATGLFNVVSEQLSVGQGPVQVSLVDMDGDQDKDIVVSNLRSKSLSILRNRLSQEGAENPTSMLFEPAESFGVAQISIGPRLVFAPGDFNQSGTIDLALINSESNSVKILNNELIDGAHRAQLTGTGTTDKKNFGIKSEILKPSMDPFISPIELLEDAAPLSIPMTGIKRGRVSGPPLRVTAISSNPAVIPHPSVVYTEGATTGRIEFAPSKDTQGQAMLSVMVRDAGADGLFETNDDGTIERTLLVSVKPVNDPPSIALRGNQIITQGSNLRSVSNFATAFRPGGGIDERSQSIAEFIVTNDRTDLFLSQPAIDNDGNLRFQPSLNQSGTAKIGVQVRDNGGTDSGGIDRSPLQFFQIFVTDLADGDIDFGDAPTATQSRLASSYPTQLKENGARHRTGQLYLGSLVDAEQDGQPTSGASGDDQKIDDEDGINFAVTAMSSPILPTIASLVAIASASSKLDAWIDFNQDGDWNDSGEQILASASVTTGRNLIGFTIPAGSKTGMTYARFRLSSLGGLGVTGLAEDGEVEDHPFQILDTQTTNTLTLFESELGQHELFVTGGSLVVRAQGKPVFSGPASNIERVLLVTSSGQTLYEILRPIANLFGTLQFVDANTPIAISTSEPNLNLAGYPTGSLYGIHTLDFSAAVPQVLQTNATSIAAFNADKSVKILLGEQDSIESSLGWVLETRLLEQSKLVQVFKQSSSIVRIESSLPWQNPMNRLDADGDGTVSPLDVLVIINHLNRSSGSTTNGNLPVFDSTNPMGQRFVDTNGSNTSEPLDVLVVINYLNQRDRAGEGELKASYPMSRSHRNGRDHSRNNAILEMVPELPEENAEGSQ
jgi:Tol biopolymer transport system component